MNFCINDIVIHEKFGTGRVLAVNEKKNEGKPEISSYRISFSEDLKKISAKEAEEKLTLAKPDGLHTYYFLFPEKTLSLFSEDPVGFLTLMLRDFDNSTASLEDLKTSLIPVFQDSSAAWEKLKNAIEEHGNLFVISNENDKVLICRKLSQNEKLCESLINQKSDEAAEPEIETLLDSIKNQKPTAGDAPKSREIIREESADKYYLPLLSQENLISRMRMIAASPSNPITLRMKVFSYLTRKSGDDKQSLLTEDEADSLFLSITNQPILVYELEGESARKAISSGQKLLKGQQLEDLMVSAAAAVDKEASKRAVDWAEKQNDPVLIGRFVHSLLSDNLEKAISQGETKILSRFANSRKLLQKHQPTNQGWTEVLNDFRKITYTIASLPAKKRDPFAQALVYFADYLVKNMPYFAAKGKQSAPAILTSKEIPVEFVIALMDQTNSQEFSVLKLPLLRNMLTYRPGEFLERYIIHQNIKRQDIPVRVLDLVETVPSAEMKSIGGKLICGKLNESKPSIENLPILNHLMIWASGEEWESDWQKARNAAYQLLLKDENAGNTSDTVWHIHKELIDDKTGSFQDLIAAKDSELNELKTKFHDMEADLNDKKERLLEANNTPANQENQNDKNSVFFDEWKKLCSDFTASLANFEKYNLAQKEPNRDTTAMIKKLLQVLKRHGIESYGSINSEKPYDPETDDLTELANIAIGSPVRILEQGFYIWDEFGKQEVVKHTKVIPLE